MLKILLWSGKARCLSLAKDEEFSTTASGGPPPFERRQGFMLAFLFCANLFCDFQNDGTRERVPYREWELFRSAQAHFKPDLCRTEQNRSDNM